eukprot:COSAG02_NODE_6316_length_3655_cov_2.787120_1_plen_79_part_00
MPRCLRLSANAARGAARARRAPPVAVRARVSYRIVPRGALQRRYGTVLSFPTLGGLAYGSALGHTRVCPRAALSARVG